MSYKAVIFDLDGTLMDTSEGILKSVDYTIEKLGYETLDDKTKRTFIGPPIKHSLKRAYQLTEDQAEYATQIFRERYKNHDLMLAKPYLGITELLKFLRANGYKTAVATLKREDYAIDLLHHFGLAHHLDQISGSDFASKMNKTDVLKVCLKEMGLESKDAILIGDTGSDANGAKELDMDFMAVFFGFGFQNENDLKETPHVFGAENVNKIINYFKCKR